MNDAPRPGLVALASDLVRGLPGPFLALVVCNAVCFLGLLWFFERRDAARVSVIGSLLTACIHSGGP